jgi:hypothetical protein
MIVDQHCPEGYVTCEDVRCLEIDKKTGKSIILLGRTVHATGADGVTPSHFLGYMFKSGQLTCFLGENGELQVSRGTKVVLEERGIWERGQELAPMSLGFQRAGNVSMGNSELHIIPLGTSSKKVERALKFYVARFSTHATNHFYVGVTKLDRKEPLTALVYWKEARLLMDYGELEDDAPARAEIFALNHPLKLDRDTVDTPEDIAGSTYLATHRQWVTWMEQCISKGGLYVITLDEASSLFPNTDRPKAENE